jgi:hypothetical protein
MDKRILRLDEHRSVTRRELEPILQMISKDMHGLSDTVNTHAVILALVMEKLGITGADVKARLKQLAGGVEETQGVRAN